MTLPGAPPEPDGVERIGSLPIGYGPEVRGAEGVPRALDLFDRALAAGDPLGAWRLFRREIREPLFLERRDAGRCVALLERLLPGGLDLRLLCAAPQEHGSALNALGLAYQAAGRPGLSLEPLARALTIDDGVGTASNRVITRRNLARGLLDCGRLREAEGALDAASALAASAGLEDQKRFLLVESWGARALRGLLGPAPLQEASALCAAAGDRRVGSVVRTAHAQRRLWIARAVFDEVNGMPPSDWNRAQRLQDALDLARSAGEDVEAALKETPENAVDDLLRARRLRGVAGLLRGGSGDLGAVAVDLGQVADQAARSANLVEEIPALLTLAELGLQAGRSEDARKRLEAARARLAGSDYRLFEADFQVLSSRFEQAVGRLPESVAAAARAYQLSWCDGPPFVYHWGLVAARRQLAALGAAEPRVADPDPGNRDRGG